MLNEIRYIDFHRHSAVVNHQTTVLCNLATHNFESVELPKRGFYSAGLHPWFIGTNWELDFAAIEVMVKNNKSIVAIGECGLDKKCKTNFELQEEVVRAHFQLAEVFQRPLIIHCVRAYNEILQLKQQTKFNMPIAIHNFCGPAELAVQLVKQGFYLSFGMQFMNIKSRARKAFQVVPIDRVFMETDDAAFSIEEIYQEAIKHKNISLLDFSRQMVRNFNWFLGI